MLKTLGKTPRDHTFVSEKATLEELRLVSPSTQYADEIMSYRRESLASDGDINGSNQLADYEDPADWIAYCHSAPTPDKAPVDWVDFEEWMLVDKFDAILGLINIRHSLATEYIAEWVGHIGYSIRPSRRRHGYATIQLRLGLDKCRLLGFNRVLVTCDTRNEASRRTIVACGGVFERLTDKDEDGRRITLERYWITL